MAAAFFTLPARWQLTKTLRLVQNLPAVKLHLSGVAMIATEAEFEKAKNKLKTLKNDPGNEVKLQIYALFKQATQGPCDSPKPSMLDFVNKAKWDAWNSLGKTPKEEARQKYVDLIETLVSAEIPNQSEATTTRDVKSSFQTINVTSENNITTILLNRPAKKNAISVLMYEEIMKALEQAAKDDSTLTVMTGYFQSLAFSKQLIRDVEKEKLHAVNAQECERLVERWLSEECMNAIMGFFAKKSKL
ncbi:enoyl-CoA delta isomerase 2 [Rhincodon typus]|uniref:enoyl-CoA delta isomerase 2 n=1 Tax=Rhincodon typus TaxID=259920 RepID=UPI00202E8CEF|nr:enoyl-CoA delta isomerase 2 [Rhincodon typus]